MNNFIKMIKSPYLWLVIFTIVMLAFPQLTPAGVALGLTVYNVPGGVPYKTGQENMPGVYKGYIIAHDDILTFPPRAKDGVNLIGDFVLKAGKKFSEFYFTDGSAGISIARQGERDGGSIKNTATFKSPGYGDLLVQLINSTINGAFVLIFIDSQGNKLVLGTDLFKCYLTASEGGSGVAAEDYRGITFTYECDQPHTALKYAGVFDNTIINDAQVSAPTATVATSIAATTATVNWTLVAEATSYRVDVSAVSDFSTFVTGYEDLAVSSENLSLDVTALTTATQYYYRVRAELQEGGESGTLYTSESSNTITFTTA